MNTSASNYPRILIHCQYVYGIGHFVRTVELARGLSNFFQVNILVGGQFVPNFELPLSVNFIQLPAIYKEEGLQCLTPVDDLITLEECFVKRGELIAQSVDNIKPDILITEHFPFGLLFEDEVMGLIYKVKERNAAAKIVCSVRDLIETSKGGKNDEYICDLINNYYDLVLVHGDRKFAPLSSSFPRIVNITVPIIHSGYIVRSFPVIKINDSIPIILTSVAGGRLGNELLDAVINCHLKIKTKQKHKLILFSGAFQEDFQIQQERVASLQSEDITIHIFDSQHYRECLSCASLVISLAGYNSIIESVSMNKPMLVYQRGFLNGNDEQNLRINLFESSGHLEVILPEDLKVGTLTELIIKQINKVKVPKVEINLNGVGNSYQCLINLYSGIQ